MDLRKLKHIFMCHPIPGNSKVFYWQKHISQTLFKYAFRGFSVVKWVSCLFQPRNGCCTSHSLVKLIFFIILVQLVHSKQYSQGIVISYHDTTLYRTSFDVWTIPPMYGHSNVWMNDVWFIHRSEVLSIHLVADAPTYGYVSPQTLQ